MPLVSAGVYYDISSGIAAFLLPPPPVASAPVILQADEAAPYGLPGAIVTVPLTNPNQSGRLDSVGNIYGGTTTNKNGVGDQVKDKYGTVGVIQKIWPDTQTGRLMVIVAVVPGGFSFAASDLFGGAALTQTGTPGQVSWRQEYVEFADQLTITAHADGTALVQGGNNATVPAASEVVWDKKYLP